MMLASSTWDVVRLSVCGTMRSDKISGKKLMKYYTLQHCHRHTYAIFWRYLWKNYYNHSPASSEWLRM